MNMMFSQPLTPALVDETYIITLNNFGVTVPRGMDSLSIVHGVDLSLRAGESLGIVGESGCGKSITWLAALRLLGGVRISGQFWFRGSDLVSMSEHSVASLRGGKIAMIFQDPASCLNPIQRIGRQIGEALRLHRGLGGSAARAEAKRLLDRVGIAGATRLLEQYPHELSGGMNQRVMIAMALAGEPEVLIADEPTTALDATIQAQILDLLSDIRRQTGMALILISHDLGVVAEMCDRIAVMYAGRFVETGPGAQILSHPQHPYTRGLLAALPALDGPRRRLSAIGGVVPAPGALPAGCAFAPRCDLATEICHASRPPFSPREGDAETACWHVSGDNRDIRAQVEAAA